MDHLPSYQTLRRMAYFAVIADAGSIRGAARQLRLSVPVVSAALAELEAELGVSLATRTTRSFRLTQAGQSVRDKAQAIVVLAGEALAIGAPDRELTGRLSLTLAVELAAHWLPPILTEFRARHPKVNLHVDSNDDVVNLAGSGFDLAIRTTRSRDGRGLPLVCVVADGVLGADWSGKVPLPLVGGGGQGERLTAKERATGADAELVFDGTLEVSNKATVREMVRTGLGAGLLIDIGLDGGFQAVDDRLDFGAVSLEILLRDTLPSAEVAAFLAMDVIRDVPVSGRKDMTT